MSTPREYAFARLRARRRVCRGQCVHLGIIVACIGPVTFAACQPAGADRAIEVRASLDIGQTLGGDDTTGFQRAMEPRPLVFPEDHGAHPGYRNEWWYLTGNVETADGRTFGYQLTLFRAAIAPDMPDRTSEWATRQAWMAHFAVTDVGGGRFHAFERFSREAVGLAGAEHRPFRAWVEDWTIASLEGGPAQSREASPTAALPGTRAPTIDPAARAPENRQPAGAGQPPLRDARAIFPLRVHAAHNDISIDLRLDPGKPLVLNGDAGLSRKGEDTGNASFHYSFTRMPTTGTITIGESQFTVSGDTWLDREWSTSALAPGVEGWDWFAIQLVDSTEIMLYRLRRGDGSTDPFSAGTFVAADGSITRVGSADFDVDVDATWTSPRTGTRYPARWTLTVPSLDLTLDVQPVLADQELDLSFRYWEGAVAITGTRAGRPVTGRGYAELTGYGS